MILGSVANLKYEMAVLLPEKKEDAVNIVALGMFVTLLIFILII